MRGGLASIAVCAGLAAACSNKNDHPGAPIQDSGPPPDTYIDTYAPDTRVDAPDATGDVTGDVDAGDAGDSVFTLPDGGPPLCPESSAWSTSTLVPSASTTDSDVLGSITPDELSVAWTAASGATINYADRATTADAFGTPKTIAAAGVYALERVALSPDGLRLVAVTNSRKAFVQMTRAKRGDAFGTASPDAFSVINATTAETGFVGDPVFAGDDKTFFYSFYGTLAMVDTVWKATFSGGGWTGYVPLVDVALKAVAEKRKRPTGVSKDLRTLFVLDESTGNAMALWSPAVGWTFISSRNLGAKTSVQPTGDCTKIWFSAPASDAGSSLDIFYAK